VDKRLLKIEPVDLTIDEEVPEEMSNVEKALWDSCSLVICESKDEQDEKANKFGLQVKAEYKFETSKFMPPVYLLFNTHDVLTEFEGQPNLGGDYSLLWRSAGNWAPIWEIIDYSNDCGLQWNDEQATLLQKALGTTLNPKELTYYLTTIVYTLTDEEIDGENKYGIRINEDLEDLVQDAIEGNKRQKL